LTQEVQHNVEFSGVVVNLGCECLTDVADFWNSTSFELVTNCTCEYGDTFYIESGEDDTPMGEVSITIDATSITVNVVENAHGTDGSGSCPCDDVFVEFILDGLTAPFDCNPGNIPYDSQSSPGGFRTDWSGATCTVS
jgi:hypothetical protein